MMLLAVAAWIALGVMGVLFVTLALRWSSIRPVTVLQALTPYVVAPAFPIAVVALLAQHWILAGAATAAAVTLVVLSWPLVCPAAQPEPRPGAIPIRVFHGNLFYVNERHADIATTVAALNADVLTFTEYTPDHAAGFAAHPLGARFPHRIEYPDPKTGGTAIWSRFPLTGVDTPASQFRSSAAIVGAPDPLVVLAVHPPSPFVSIDGWARELGQVGEFQPNLDVAAMIVGDFNAAYWHPPFRRLLDAGWRDAHQTRGSGFSNSWPSDRAVVPPVVRLDHALVNDRLVVSDIRDVDVPGSDHLGLLVTVLPSVVGEQPR